MLAGLAAMVAAGVWAQAARAGDVETLYHKFMDAHGGSYAYFEADFQALDGEANTLTVAAGGSQNNPLKFHDDGATITTRSNGVAAPYPAGFDGAAACSALGHDAKCYEVDSPLYTAQHCDGSYVNFVSPLCPGDYLSGFSTVGIALGDGNDSLILRLAPTTVPFDPVGDLTDLGAGDDRVDSRDGAAEYIECGPGIDTAVVDAYDSVADCENVTRG